MKTILLIEDEPKMRRNLMQLLELDGFRALAAPNGAEGITIALRELPDLILCDITMPGTDGHGVLKALRAERATATTPFIFLTAKGDRTDLRAGMNLGADDYLIKPVTRDDLISAISARLQRAAQHGAELRPTFESPAPLEELGLTPREAEVLFWVAQGKTNAEIGIILDASPATVKKHVEHILEKLEVENRAAASLRALEILAQAPGGSSDTA
ncbi:MAG TPA: response regulator transcription factor [Chthoniobacteraceae bacterium]|nr:response regulator transcription factor [Chthoniobacteraceae bacterium]